MTWCDGVMETLFFYFHQFLQNANREQNSQYNLQTANI